MTTIEPTWKIHGGDCAVVLDAVENDCVDLIVTSPPYSDQRKDLYGGPHPDNYVEWFLPRAAQFWRVLKSTGTMMINIKERVSNGVRHPYVLQLIQALSAEGWLWTEEFIWHKKNSSPGKWPNRFRDGWERCLQFNKQKKFAMYQDAVRAPVKSWAAGRLANPSKNDDLRHTSKVGSGFGRKVSNWQGRDTVYPDNVLHMATECGNKSHGAAFPITLPSWFIRLFTEEGDLVLDPFSGSGTTGLAAVQLGRSYLGVELLPEFVDVSRLRLSDPWAEPTAEEILTEERAAEQRAKEALRVEEGNEVARNLLDLNPFG